MSAGSDAQAFVDRANFGRVNKKDISVRVGNKERPGRDCLGKSRANRNPEPTFCAPKCKRRKSKFGWPILSSARRAPAELQVAAILTEHLRPISFLCEIGLARVDANLSIRLRRSLGMSQAASGAQGSRLDDERQACARSCLECQNACEACAGDCLASADMMEVTQEAVRRALDCAELCGLCATLLARKSDLYVAACALCAAACERCAAECQKHDLPACQRCAAACRSAAESCRKMAQSAAEPA